MFACLDVHYDANNAHAAAILFDDWTAVAPLAKSTAWVSDVVAYQSGEFYLRELHPLLTVIQKLEQPIDCYVLDGYCHLSAELAPGLGAYLYEALGSGAPVIGVAKNRYRDTTHAVELVRAKSKRPLFITAIGMTYDAAARCIGSMAGEHRIPTLLKAVDRLARTHPRVPDPDLNTEQSANAPKKC